jgi:hypothetical protein
MPRRAPSENVSEPAHVVVAVSARRCARKGVVPQPTQPAVTHALMGAMRGAPLVVMPVVRCSMAGAVSRTSWGRKVTCLLRLDAVRRCGRALGAWSRGGFLLNPISNFHAVMIRPLGAPIIVPMADLLDLKK